MPWKQWAYLEKVASADFQTYLQNQAVCIFTTTTQRDAQLAAPIEGQCCYITATKTFQIYNGTAWENAPQAPRALQSPLTGGPISSGVLTLATINIPAQPRAYNLEVLAACTAYGDTVGDHWMLTTRVTNTIVGGASIRLPTVNFRCNFGIAAATLTPLAANTAITVSTVMTRITGTGTLTLDQANAVNIMTARLFV